MIRKVIDLKSTDEKGELAALRRSARRALEIGLETGTPVYVLKKGRIVDLTKEPLKRQKRQP